MRQLVFDIEANGLEPTQVWCVVLYESATNNTHVCYNRIQLLCRLNGTFDPDAAMEPVELIGHNILAYDVPVLEKLWGISFAGHKLTDTLVMSRLSDPSRLGGHSLENWGTI